MFQKLDVPCNELQKFEDIVHNTVHNTFYVYRTEYHLHWTVFNLMQDIMFAISVTVERRAKREFHEHYDRAI